jgi:signal transduction histidine kinase
MIGSAFRSAVVPAAKEPAAGSVLARRLPYVAAGWLVFALAQWLLSRVSTRSFDEAWDIALGLSGTACWIGLTIAIWSWVGFLDRHARSRVATLAGHALGILACGTIDAVWRTTSQRLVYGGDKGSMTSTLLYFFDLTVVAYVATVVLERVADAHDAVVRQERRELTLRAQLARAQLAYHEMQLQPHFLFNSLGAVLELAHEAPATAARMLRQLSTLLRFALHGRAQTVTLAEELDALEPYLEIQRLRFADWLTISRQASPDALGVRVPRMTLQPIVENAIRHGLAGRTERGHIAIDGTLDDGMLSLRVSDNGVGLGTAREPEAPGIGLRNLSSRLRTLYGDDARVTLQTAPGGGAITEVRLRADLVLPGNEGGPDDSEPVAPPPARLPDLLRRNPVATIAIGWLLWGLFWVQLNLTWMSLYARRAIPWTLPVVRDYGTGVFAWGLVTPMMLAAARRNSLTGKHRWWHAAIHVALACGFAMLHIAIWQLIERSDRPLWAPGYFETMLWTVMLYALLLALSSYHEFEGWLRERETATARLRAELAEAELTSSAVRFDPHNVLARLDVLADMVQRDASTAERALTQLADRLRAQLEAARAEPHDRPPGDGEARTLEAWAPAASVA